MPQITITIDDKNLREGLKSLSHRIINMAGPMKEFSMIMYKDVMTHFDREEGSSGKWPLLSQKTMLARAAKGYYGPMLRATGRHIYTRITMDSDKSKAIVGLNNKWATVHQFGWPERKIPQREFLWLSDDAASKVMDKIHTWLKES